MARSRFEAFWAAYETRAKIWFRLFVVQTAMLTLALVECTRLWNRPREFVRVGCDGLAQVVSMDAAAYAAYSEPNDVELTAFLKRWAEAYARGDSYSIVNDWTYAGRYLRPELRRQLIRVAKGTDDRPGLVATIEALKRRTQIDPASFKVELDKSAWPWRARVAGIRQVVGETSGSNEPFELELELVRASRNEIPEGILIWSVRSKGDPALGVPLGRAAAGDPS